MGRPKVPLAVRFWNKVDKNGPIIVCELGPCWIWTASGNIHGYGRIGENHRHVTAHRVSWRIHNGAIPEGLCVLHRCDNPPCVNPDHLFLGTMKDNMQDMARKQRGVRGANRKVNEAQVREIRERRAQGNITYKALGELYGLTIGGVRAITDRRTWPEVE